MAVSSQHQSNQTHFDPTPPNIRYWHIGGGGDVLNKQLLEFYSCIHHKGSKLALVPSEFHFPEGAPGASAQSISCLLSKPAKRLTCLGSLGSLGSSRAAGIT